MVCLESYIRLKKRKRAVSFLIKLLVSALVIGILLLVTFSIRTNLRYDDVPEQRFGVNEWVDLGDSFYDSIEEHRQGYYLMVEEAKLCSASEFASSILGLRTVNDLGEVKDAVLAVKVRIRNQDNVDAMISTPDVQVFPEQKMRTLLLNEDLLHLSAFGKEGQLFNIAIPPNSEKEVWLPFVTNLGKEKSLQRSIKGKKFELFLGVQPIRQIVDFEI